MVPTVKPSPAPTAVPTYVAGNPTPQPTIYVCQYSSGTVQDAGCCQSQIIISPTVTSIGKIIIIILLPYYYHLHHLQSP
jgi:hypothetical protein